MATRDKTPLWICAGLGVTVGLALLLVEVLTRPGDGTRKTSSSVEESLSVKERSSYSEVSVRAVGTSPRAIPSSSQPRAAATELPSATAPIRFERAPDEWQGMLPEAGEVWPCPENASGCGMGRACVDSRCTPCVTDQECLRTELCVLGVCVLTDLAGCRSKADCAEAEVCMMSGFTPLDERNNSDLQSKCVLDDWDEDMEDADGDGSKQAKEADLAYQNSTLGPPSDTDSGPDPRDPAIEALRELLLSDHAAP